MIDPYVRVRVRVRRVCSHVHVCAIMRMCMQGDAMCMRRSACMCRHACAGMYVQAGRHQVCACVQSCACAYTHEMWGRHARANPTPTPLLSAQAWVLNRGGSGGGERALALDDVVRGTLYIEDAMAAAAAVSMTVIGEAASNEAAAGGR